MRFWQNPRAFPAQHPFRLENVSNNQKQFVTVVLTMYKYIKLILWNWNYLFCYIECVNATYGHWPHSFFKKFFSLCISHHAYKYYTDRIANCMAQRPKCKCMTHQFFEHWVKWFKYRVFTWLFFYSTRRKRMLTRWKETHYLYDRWRTVVIW